MQHTHNNPAYDLITSRQSELCLERERTGACHKHRENHKADLHPHKPPGNVIAWQLGFGDTGEVREY